MGRWVRTHRARWTTTAASLAAILAAGGCAHYEPRLLVPAHTGTLLQQRTLADPGLTQFLANQHLRGAAHSPAADWDFESLAGVAVYFHPDLALARAQLSMADAAELTAGGRPNPTVMLTGGFNSSALPGIAPWFPGLTFDVPIETAGKRTYRRTKAAYLTAAARQHLWETAWTLRRTLRLALFELALAQQRVALLQEQSRLEARRGQLLAQRLAAGIATRTELTTARIAERRAEFDAGEALGLVTAARLRAAEALGLPGQSLDGVHLPSPFEGITDTPVGFSAPDAIAARELALRSRPDVLGALADYNAAQAELQLQIAKQYPDVRFSPAYQWDQGDHKWSLGLSLELPLRNRNQGPIAEAAARRKEAEAKFLGVQARVLAELEAALNDLRSAAAQQTRADAVATAQKDQARSTELAFNAGSVDALELASSQVERLAANRLRLDATATLVRAQGEFEDATRQPADRLRYFLNSEFPQSPSRPELLPP